jgi:hypothetical protein
MPTLNILNPTELIKAPHASISATAIQAQAANTRGLNLQNETAQRNQAANVRLGQLAKASANPDGSLNYDNLNKSILSDEQIPFDQRINTITQLRPEAERSQFNKALMAGYNDGTQEWDANKAMAAAKASGNPEVTQKMQDHITTVIPKWQTALDKFKQDYSDISMGVLDRLQDENGAAKMVTSDEAKSIIDDYNIRATEQGGIDATKQRQMIPFVDSSQPGALDKLKQIVDRNLTPKDRASRYDLVSRRKLAENTGLTRDAAGELALRKERISEKKDADTKEKAQKDIDSLVEGVYDLSVNADLTDVTTRSGGAYNRADVMRAMKEKHPDFPFQQRENQAKNFYDSKTQAKLRSINTLQEQMPVLLDAAKEMHNTGIPALDLKVIEAKARLGSVAASNYMTAVNIVAEDAGVSMAGGINSLTNEQLSFVKGLIPMGSTFEQVKGSAKLITQANNARKFSIYKSAGPYGVKAAQEDDYLTGDQKKAIKEGHPLIQTNTSAPEKSEADAAEETRKAAAAAMRSNSTVLGDSLQTPTPIPEGEVRRNTKTGKLMKKVGGVWQNL